MKHSQLLATALALAGCIEVQAPAPDDDGRADSEFGQDAGAQGPDGSTPPRTMDAPPDDVPTSIATGTSPTPDNPSLEGSAVTLGVHCCTAPPNDGNRTSIPITALVTHDIEFPYLRDNGLRNDLMVIPANIDVSADEIEVTYQSMTIAAEGEFNGYRLDFVPAGFKRITAASIGERTSRLQVEPEVSHTDTAIFINAGPGGARDVGSRIHVVVTLE